MTATAASGAIGVTLAIAASSGALFATTTAASGGGFAASLSRSLRRIIA